MVLLIIIPIKWLFHWEYTLFPDKPIYLKNDHIWEDRNLMINSRPRGKVGKLAWQGAWHENTMMLRMRMLPNLLPVTKGGLNHGQTACEPATRGRGVVKYEVSCNWRFQPPKNTLLKQQGFQPYLFSIYMYIYRFIGICPLLKAQQTTEFTADFSWVFPPSPGYQLRKNREKKHLDRSRRISRAL